MRRRFTLGLVLSIALLGVASAGPVQVILHVPEGQQRSIEDMWWAEMVNPTGNTYRAILVGEVTEDRQGLVFRISTDSISIPPGRKEFRLRDVRVRETWAKPGYQAFVTRTGALPEGSYSYYVRLEPDLGEGRGRGRIQRPTPAAAADTEGRGYRGDGKPELYLDPGRRHRWPGNLHSDRIRGDERPDSRGGRAFRASLVRADRDPRHESQLSDTRS